MRTLADVVNSSKNATVDLENCIIVKEHKNNKFNIVCKLNNKKVYVNYVDLDMCKDGKLFIKYGKKEENWQEAHWYQVEAEEEKAEEEKTSEDEKEDK